MLNRWWNTYLHDHMHVVQVSCVQRPMNVFSFPFFLSFQIRWKRMEKLCGRSADTEATIKMHNNGIVITSTVCNLRVCIQHTFCLFGIFFCIASNGIGNSNALAGESMQSTVTRKKHSTNACHFNHISHVCAILSEYCLDGRNGSPCWIYFSFFVRMPVCE